MLAVSGSEVKVSNSVFYLRFLCVFAASGVRGALRAGQMANQVCVLTTFHTRRDILVKVRVRVPQAGSGSTNAAARYGNKEHASLSPTPAPQ
eukprot:scaffold515_cov101-Isochrysis_galbana.AAC.2